MNTMLVPPSVWNRTGPRGHDEERCGHQFVLSHFVIAPPLIIEREQIDAEAAALDEALGLADAQV